MLNKFTFTLICLTISIVSICQIPQGYYNLADGKKQAELKTAFHTIIRQHTFLEYDLPAYIWWNDYFSQTDWHPNNYYWDMYSNEERPVYEGGLMNREHSMPRSWWGTSSTYNQFDANGDLHNLYPSDYDANTEKSNYALGEVLNPTFNNGVCKVGVNSFSGYNGTVFEPADEYKGDFARTYMYMVTCYEDYSSNWRSTGISSMLLNNAYPTLKPYAINLLMKWHRNDPVSEKEINRNNEVYKIQNNRNPFVDFPILAEYIWGNKTDEYFYLENVIDPNIPVEVLNVSFESSLDPFFEYNVKGYQNWYVDANYKYAKISGHFNGENNENEDWLISPAMDLSILKSATVEFDHTGKLFNAPFTDMTFWISKNYNNGDDPYNSVWTELEIPHYMSGDDWIFVSSGKVDLGNYLNEKNVRIAFKYISSALSAATWEIKNVKVTGIAKGGESDIESIPQNNLNMYTIGRKIYFNAYKGEIIELFNISGQKIFSQEANIGENIIDMQTSGILLIKIGEKPAQKVILR